MSFKVELYGGDLADVVNDIDFEVNKIVGVWDETELNFRYYEPHDVSDSESLFIATGPLSYIAGLRRKAEWVADIQWDSDSVRLQYGSGGVTRFVRKEGISLNDSFIITHPWDHSNMRYTRVMFSAFPLTAITGEVVEVSDWSYWGEATAAPPLYRPTFVSSFAIETGFEDYWADTLPDQNGSKYYYNIDQTSTHLFIISQYQVTDEKKVGFYYKYVTGSWVFQDTFESGIINPDATWGRWVHRDNNTDMFVVSDGTGIDYYTIAGDGTITHQDRHETGETFRHLHCATTFDGMKIAVAACVDNYYRAWDLADGSLEIAWLKLYTSENRDGEPGVCITDKPVSFQTHTKGCTYYNSTDYLSGVYGVYRDMDTWATRYLDHFMGYALEDTTCIDGDYLIRTSLRSWDGSGSETSDLQINFSTMNWWVKPPDWDANVVSFKSGSSWIGFGFLLQYFDNDLKNWGPCWCYDSNGWGSDVGGDSWQTIEIEYFESAYRTVFNRDAYNLQDMWNDSSFDTDKLTTNYSLLMYDPISGFFFRVGASGTYGIYVGSLTKVGIGSEAWDNALHNPGRIATPYYLSKSQYIKRGATTNEYDIYEFAGIDWTDSSPFDVTFEFDLQEQIDSIADFSMTNGYSEPAGTTIKLLFSEDNVNWEKWSGSAWVAETDIANGNTVAEFTDGWSPAVSYGGSITKFYVKARYETTDPGVAPAGEPHFTSVALITSSNLYTIAGDQAFDVEHLSETETRFTSKINSQLYVEALVFLMAPDIDEGHIDNG